MNFINKKTISFTVLIVIVGLSVFGYTFRERLAARWKLYQRGYEFSQKEFFTQIKSGDPKIVDLFLQSGMKKTAVNKNGKSIALVAIESENKEVINFLKKREVRLKKDDRKAFFAIVKEGRPETLEWFFELGIDENVRTHNGETPIHVASKASNLENLKFLVNRDISLNLRDNSGLTALHYAAINESKKVTDFLIEQGSSLNKETADSYYDVGKGYTPLMIAVQKKNKELAKILIEAGADVGVPSDEKNALTVALNNDASGLKNLILGQDLNADLLGKALATAVEENNFELMKRLVQEGANVNYSDERTSPPLHEAAFEAREKFVKFLLNNGANVDVRDDHMRGTPLLTAAEEGHLEIIKILLKHEANINAQNKSGDTPVILACVAGQWRAKDILVRNGANMSIENDYGDSGYEMCR